MSSLTLVHCWYDALSRHWDSGFVTSSPGGASEEEEARITLSRLQRAGAGAGAGGSTGCVDIYILDIFFLLL